ncbi:M15 family metallopeptidase [Patescibacteria group bacterium]|nr:M15 family metallopeptidase [Patescibacteria group bacterium]
MNPDKVKQIFDAVIKANPQHKALVQLLRKSMAAGPSSQIFEKAYDRLIKAPGFRLPPQAGTDTEVFKRALVDTPASTWIELQHENNPLQEETVEEETETETSDTREEKEKNHREQTHAPHVEKKPVPIDPERFNKAIKKEVVNKMTNGRTSDEYRLSEKAVFEDWIKDQKNKKLTPEEYKETQEYKDKVDEHFANTHREDFDKNFAAEKTKVYLNPNDDPVIKEYKKMLVENRDQQDNDSNNQNKASARQSIRQTFKEQFKEKAEGYQISETPEALEISDPNIIEGNFRVINDMPAGESIPVESSFSPEAPVQNISQEVPRIHTRSIPQTPRAAASEEGGFMTRGINFFNSFPGKNFLKFGRFGAGGGGAAAGGAAAGGGEATVVAGGAVAAAGGGEVAIIIIIIILIIVLLVLLIIFGSKLLRDSAKSYVTITKSVDKTEVPNPQPGSTLSDMTFTINVSYPGTFNKLNIADPIPQNAEFVSATGNYTLDQDSSGNVTNVKWTIPGTANSSLTAVDAGAQAGFSFDEAKFKSYGFPTPQQEALPQSGLNMWKTYIMKHAAKAAQITGTDIGIIGMWPIYEGNPSTFYDNCNDGKKGGDFNPNTICLFNNWQVGYGVRPMETLSYLQEAFDNMHPGESVQSVGQAVINESATRDPKNKITNLSTFPNVGIDDIVKNAKNDSQKRLLAGILMKDDAIGTFVVAKVFRGIQGPSMASTMKGWSESYYKPQKIINYIKGVYDAGLSDASSPTQGESVQLTLRPKATTKDDYIVNQASVEVIGGQAGQCTPGDTTSIATQPVTPKSSYSYEQKVGIFGDPGGKPTSCNACGTPPNQNWESQNIVSGTFFGFPIKMHRLALPYLKAVEAEIKASPDPATRNYKITSVGEAGYCFRQTSTVSGCGGPSNHSFGTAIDLNPSTNRQCPGGCWHDIPNGLVEIMKKWGFAWGGNFSSKYIDYMHFEWQGADPNSPTTQAGTQATCPAGGENVSLGENIAPNQNTCNGKYKLVGGEHNGNNFGDPSCELAQSPSVVFEKWQPQQYLVNLLQQLDPGNVRYWIGIAKCESGFDPNAYFAGATNGAAHGLFQMDYSRPDPYQPIGAKGLNGIYDRGDVIWKIQTSNAISYNNNLIKLGLKWRYWACARSQFGLW